MPTKIFVNLPVKDLGKSIDFFTGLDFSFNSQFTDKNATCMVISDNIYAMLLVEPFFKSFTNKDIVDATKSTEVILALEIDSRERVDELVGKALAAGGQSGSFSSDDGFMYARSFQDVDGHLWEVLYMDRRRCRSMRQHLNNRVAAGLDGADPSSLLQVIFLDTRNRIRSKEHLVVAFAGAVDARSRTVRIVASSEDDGVHAEGGKVLVQASSVEGTPAWFPDSNLVCAEVLQMACDESGRVEIWRTGQAEFWCDL